MLLFLYRLKATILGLTEVNASLITFESRYQHFFENDLIRHCKHNDRKRKILLRTYNSYGNILLR